MDYRSRYRQLIQEALTDYHQATAATIPGVERQLILDTERDHYLLMTVGWQGQQRVDGCVLHLDLKDDQIWIQHDGTEGGIAHDLVARGIPAAAIVLGFQAPYKRPYTGFGVGTVTSVPETVR